MVAPWRTWLDRLKTQTYGRRHPLILINGLAEQAESWYPQPSPTGGGTFDVHMPNILVYEGAALHRRIDGRRRRSRSITSSNNCTSISNRSCRRRPITWSPAAWAARSPSSTPSATRKTSRARTALSLGHGRRGTPAGRRGRAPQRSARTDRQRLLRCPDGRRPAALIYYRDQFANRRWRSGLLRTIRGTMDHCVRDRLARVHSADSARQPARTTASSIRVRPSARPRLLPQGAVRLHSAMRPCPADGEAVADQSPRRSLPDRAHAALGARNGWNSGGCWRSRAR